MSKPIKVNDVDLKLFSLAEVQGSRHDDTPGLVQASVPKAPENGYYEIQAIPGKGYGCVAAKDLKRGTRILADRPLLMVSIADYLRSDIEAAFEKLSAAEKLVYFSLASSHGQDANRWPKMIHGSVSGREEQRIKEQHYARVAEEPSLISIFQTNCMELGGGAAIFPNAARFNHSCHPNANFSWNPAIQKETIHITKEVKAGEEITLSYCDMTHEKAARAWELKHYGFVCDCPACTEDIDLPETFANKSADQRFRIAELDRATKFRRGPRLEVGAKQPEFVGQLLELAKLYNELGLYSVELANIYLELALVCEMAGDFANARMCAANAVRVKRDCHGADFPDYEKYEGVLKRISGKCKE